MTIFGRDIPLPGVGIRFGRGYTAQAWIIDGRPHAAIHRTSQAAMLWFCARVAG